MCIKGAADSLFDMSDRKFDFEKNFDGHAGAPSEALRSPFGRISFENASESDLKAIFLS